MNTSCDCSYNNLTTILFTTPVFADIWGNCYTCNLPKPSEKLDTRQKILKGWVDRKKVYDL